MRPLLVGKDAFCQAACGLASRRPTISTCGRVTKRTFDGDIAIALLSTAWWLADSAPTQTAVSTVPTATAIAKRASADSTGCGRVARLAARAVMVLFPFGAGHGGLHGLECRRGA